MRMSLRMKKCWMKKEGPDSNWRHVFHHTSVCDCVCYLYISGHLEGPDCLWLIRVCFSSLSGGEYDQVEGEEGRGGNWDAREQRTHRQMVRRQVSVTSVRTMLTLYCTVGRMCSVTWPVLFAACPSTWGTKCLTFTKLLFRETTTTCSSDRVLDCRDRPSSRPSWPSGDGLTSSCSVTTSLTPSHQSQLCFVLSYCSGSWTLSATHSTFLVQTLN